MQKKIKLNWVHITMSVLFISCIILSNSINEKVISVFGLDLTGGLFIFPAAYVFICIIIELLGSRKAYYTIGVGTIYYLVVFIARILFNSINSFRMDIFSLVAYLAGFIVCSIVFSKLRLLTEGNYLCVRVFCTILVGAGLDSVIFTNGAFLGVLPNGVVGNMFYIHFVFKVLYGILLIPLLYALISLLKNKVCQSDTNI